jgi:uncharacterized protein (DUF433 family)
MEAHKYLGVGLYTIPEAARIVRVPPARLRRWLQGYKYRDRVAEPVVHRRLPELRDYGVLTFLDLVELLLVARYREQGVSLQIIRENAKIVSHRVKSHHPFAVERFHRIGHDLIAETAARDPQSRPPRLYEDLRKHQLVLFEVAEAFIDRLEYRDNLARQYWPLGKDRKVVLDPAKAFGQPTDPETAVPTHVLNGPYRAGDSAEEVARSFNVDLDAVHAAIEYEQLLAQTA